jgi:hypothetical protein
MRWWQAKKRDEDLVRELQSDLDLEEEEQRERGLSPEEARYAARRAFGNSTLIREQTRAVWNWNWLEQLVRELKYGTRTGLYGVLSYLVTQGCKGQNQIGHEALTGRGLAENLVHPAPRRIPRFRPDIHFCRRPSRKGRLRSCSPGACSSAVLLGIPLSLASRFISTRRQLPS